MESRFYKLVPYHISRIKKSRPAYPFKSSGALKQFDELVKAYLSPKGYGVPYTQKAFTYTDVKEVATKNEAGEVVKTKVYKTISDICLPIQVRFKMKGY